MPPTNGCVPRDNGCVPTDNGCVPKDENRSESVPMGCVPEDEERDRDSEEEFSDTDSVYLAKKRLPIQDELSFIDSKRCMTFSGMIREVPNSILLDSGSSGDFISTQTVRVAGLKLIPLKRPTRVRAANGYILPCNAYVRARVRLGGLKFRLNLRVIDMTPSVCLECLS